MRLSSVIFSISELAILLIVLVLIFYNFGAFYGAGDSIIIVLYFFAAIFLVDSIFYLVLRFLLGLKQKFFLRNFLVALVIALLLGIAVYATISSTGRSERIGILFLPPLILLGLRHLFLKLLAKRK